MESSLKVQARVATGYPNMGYVLRSELTPQPWPVARTPTGTILQTIELPEKDTRGRTVYPVISRLAQIKLERNPAEVHRV